MAFQKGESGNPAGRKPGTTPATKLKIIIAENMPDILVSMIEQAKSGDTIAAKELMDKVIPGLKSQAMPVSIAAENNLSKQSQAVGNVPPDVGAALITALSNQSKLVEMEELNQRLARIEKQFKSRS